VRLAVARRKERKELVRKVMAIGTIKHL